MKNETLMSSLLICLFASVSFGQVGKNDPPNPGNNQYELPQNVQELNRQRQKMDERHGRDKNGMIIQPPAERKPIPPMTDEQKEIFKENLKNYENTLRRLKAPAAYYKKYESFLEDDKTGLARLFVDKNCDQGKTITVEELERCGDFIPVKGGGSYYSFRLRANTSYSRDWWDLHFVDGQLKAGNNAVQTIIAEIGDVDLEAVKSNSKAFEFLKKYKPKGTLKEIKEQTRVLEKGIKANGFSYSNLAAVNLNSTYVLRSVAYRLDDEKVYNVEGEVIKLNRPYSSGRAMDVTVAFKIVGREKDGSLILLWKELKLGVPRKVLK